MGMTMMGAPGCLRLRLQCSAVQCCGGAACSERGRAGGAVRMRARGRVVA